MGDSPGLSVITRSLEGKEGGTSVKVRKGRERMEAGFDSGGMGQQLRNAGYLWKPEKAKGQIFH